MSNEKTICFDQLGGTRIYLYEMMRALDEWDELPEDERDPDEAELAEAAREILAEVDNSETLIREDDFVDYAKELASDIGAVADSGEWPTSYIDWDAAADALLIDYTEYEWDGNTYYCRA